MSSCVGQDIRKKKSCFKLLHVWTDRICARVLFLLYRPAGKLTTTNVQILSYMQIISHLDHYI